MLTIGECQHKLTSMIPAADLAKDLDNQDPRLGLRAVAALRQLLGVTAAPPDAAERDHQVRAAVRLILAALAPVSSGSPGGGAGPA